MADLDKERIDALLHELRTWDVADSPLSVADLARRHHLDPMIVRRLAESEDVNVVTENGVPDEIDEEAETGPIDLD